MRAIYLSVLLLAAVPTSGAGNWAPASRLDAYFDALAKQGLSNGSIAISEKGELRYQRTLGFARLVNGRGDPADPVTRYRVGSVTQLFTAVLAMQLVEKASMTLDGRVAEFYPDLPNALTITYRDLLRQRSGLADYTDNPFFASWRTAPQTHAQMLEFITGGGAVFPPRERVQASDSNSLLVGYALEKIYERPYEEILRRQIVDKLGLQRTYLAGTGSASLESRSYQLNLDGGWWEMQDSDPSILGGAAGIVSTAADLVRFMDALFAGRLVSPESLSSMRNQDGGSGIGLWPYEVAGQSGLGHRGRVEGFRACVYHFPVRGLSIAVTLNASLVPLDEMVDEVLTMVVERGHAAPAFVPLQLTARQQAEYLGTWSSTEGSPRHAPFRSFRVPGQPVYLRVLAGTDTPVLRILDHPYPLVAFGNDEFLARELGLWLRFYPRSGELVSRDADWAYYFKRAE